MTARTDCLLVHRHGLQRRELRSSRHSFLGANDPYKALKTTLKAEIDEACVGQQRQRCASRAFDKAQSPGGLLVLAITTWATRR